ncbi:hypothetical protein [Streptomyces sp. SP18BB07]|uniref:hypothetical protein n=1 Tax=Streptomyces sp. SP18BB07 TaxID=3002522 RepID=UPI002E767FC1|nr:hypothetical protein [Streptomyces sp. SP18BB07]MEE1764343.1 hypothetical protein [Streptomyces sp. SP18BB07]
MSDPAPRKAPCSSPCPAALDSVELVADPCNSRCQRYNLVIVALLVVNLFVTLAGIAIGVVRSDSSTTPPPPVSNAPVDPSPSSPPTEDPTVGPEPTPSVPDPGPTACNIFDPECSPGTEV